MNSFDLSGQSIISNYEMLWGKFPYHPSIKNLPGAFHSIKQGLDEYAVIIAVI